jgi:hypothetical protein
MPPRRRGSPPAWSIADPGKFNPSDQITRVTGGNLYPNLGRSNEHQLYRQGAEQWIRAFLRKESGAAIAPGEFERDFVTYFPQPGDGPDVVQQKERARLEVKQSMIGESRGFFEHNNPDAAGRLKQWREKKADGADPLAEARAAIKQGADPAAVRQRLQQMGVNPAGL